MSTSPFKGLNKLRDTTRTLERLKTAFDRATACRRDAAKKHRREYRSCRYCWYYTTGLAGQAFTSYECEACGGSARPAATSTKSAAAAVPTSS